MPNGQASSWCRCGRPASIPGFFYMLTPSMGSHGTEDGVRELGVVEGAACAG